MTDILTFLCINLFNKKRSPWKKTQKLISKWIRGDNVRKDGADTTGKKNELNDVPPGWLGKRHTQHTLVTGDALLN